jgi:hypothetical protein
VSGSPANPTITASGMVCGINASGTVT